jgi:hypothetical protein
MRAIARHDSVSSAVRGVVSCEVRNTCRGRVWAVGVTQPLPLIDGVGPVCGKVGRPRQRAERLLADRGYDHDKYRRDLRKRGVSP